MRADNAQICHADNAVREYGHALNELVLPRIAIPQIVAESAVNFLDNHMNAGQAAGNQIFLPCFERLRHHGMVGVCKRRSGYLPRIVPCEAVFVHQYAHHLGDCERGMRIVDMNRRLLGELVERPVAMFVVVDNILQRRRNEEILLL